MLGIAGQDIYKKNKSPTYFDSFLFFWAVSLDASSFLNKKSDAVI